MPTLVQLKYGYDESGNRLYRRDEMARSNSASYDELYSYDELNRLTTFDRGVLGSGNTSLSSGPTLSQDWTLDPLGNWNRFQQGVVGSLDQTREHNQANEIIDIDKTVGAAWPTPSYDDNGNTLTFPDPRSLTAELEGTYDAWNRLVKLDDGGTLAEYQYDGTNRRIIKEANSVTRHYYYSDQWQVLEERTGSSTSADRQYVWGERYVDDLVLRDHASTRLYALSDALFNVVAVTGDDGTVLERFAYQPYGQSEPLDPDFTSYSGTNYEWEYRFTGRELDLESGLQLNRNRYLHMQLGRWLTRDPIGYDESFLNLYEYVGGLTTYLFDPLGSKAVAPPTRPSAVVMLPSFACPWRPSDCPKTCEEYYRDLKKESPNINLDRYLEDKIKELLRDKKGVQVVVRANCGGDKDFSLTCPCDDGKTAVCINKSNNLCDMLAILEHEFIHVGQIEQGIPLNTGEEQAYRKSCEVQAQQQCKDQTLNDRQLQLYIDQCVRDKVGNSLGGDNQKRISDGCKSLCRERKRKDGLNDMIK